MKLQITNIARNLSEEDFKKLFEKFGPLVESTLVMDPVSGKSKGFGFVTVGNTLSGQKAIELLNGRMVNGQKLKVKVSPT